MAKKPGRDHALALFKAGLNVVPYVGGALASLVGDYIPSSTEKAKERAAEILSEKLIQLSDRLDVDAVNKDEFSDLFKSCFLIVVRTNRDEKLQAAMAMIANLLLKAGDPAKITYEELDHLVRCLDGLSIGAIAVLGAANSMMKTFPQGQRATFQFEQLRQKFPDYDSSFLMSLVSEARSMNLLRVQEPAISVPDFGNYLLELTPIGRRFVEQFIEGRN